MNPRPTPEPPPTWQDDDTKPIAPVAQQPSEPK